MTQEEFNTYNALKEKIGEEVGKLFYYIKANYIDCLYFGRYSSYHHFDYNDKIIWIEYYDYGYDCYDSRDIDIPLKDFFNRPTEWADEWANNIRRKKENEEKEQIRRNEEKEKAELKRLKEKYEGTIKKESYIIK